MTIHIEPEALTDRQKAVLDAALAAMVAEGDGLTMNSVSKRAACSKETLYKWFGDRDGLLTATVRWQASKVHAPVIDRARLDRPALTATLEQFAREWLTVISSETSIALNRMAVSHAASGKTSVGTIVLKNGRQAMGRRLEPVLEAAHKAGLLTIPDIDAAFRTFFGLVLRDVQIRLLLGDKIKLSAPKIAAEAAAATQQFIALYGSNNQSNTKREG
jgi:AcrR family transcriptional regulator